MSDDEDYEYEYDDDASDAAMDDDGGGGGDDDEDTFEYTDEEEEADDADVALENAYYNAKGLRDSGEYDEAAEAFEGVVTMERKALRDADGGGDDDAMDDGDDDDGEGGGKVERYGPWSYKAIKQMVKLHLRSNDGSKMMEQYERMLRVVGSAGSAGISPNAVEKGVNGMLERVSSLVQGSESGASRTGSGGGGDDANDPQVLARGVYDATLRVFHPRTGASPNERLWFKTNLKYGQLLYEMNETAKLQLVIRDLLRSSGQSADGSAMGVGSATSETSAAGGASTGGGTHLMEISALQIQLYSRQKDTKKLREVFQRAMSVRGGIPHPRTLAVIQELGGKMHMTNREFDSATQAFFQAFKSYDEAGDRARLRCLKYLVMASMLHASTINPFDSQEARPYRDDPEIVAMTNLVAAFHNNDIRTFETILRKNDGRIMDDEFVREHVADLLRTIRTQVLRSVIGPYEKIRLNKIAKELNGIPVSDVESLLVGLILDGKLNGRIDQVQGILIKAPEKGGSGSSAAAGGGGGQGGSSAAGAASSGASSSGGAAESSSSVGPMGGPSLSVGGGGTGFGAAPSSLESYGTSFDARNCAALDQLTAALEQLTSAITSVGGKPGTFQQVM